MWWKLKQLYSVGVFRTHCPHQEILINQGEFCFMWQTLYPFQLCKVFHGSLLARGNLNKEELHLMWWNALLHRAFKNHNIKSKFVFSRF